MVLTGLEPRRSDLARGIVIARSTRPLEADDQHALWAALAAAGVTEPEERGDLDGDGEISRQWLSAPWLPPTAAELDAQRVALESAAATHGLDAIWCVKVETGIDGVTWLEIASVDVDDDESDADDPGEPTEVVDALFEPPEEVLYAAPDAPPPTVLTPPPVDDDEEPESEDEEILTSAPESHWRNGPPPLEDTVTFPIERYPAMIDEYDWESFGIALKLSGPSLPGEETVINAFFALWLSVYQDERADEFEPFLRADVVHDRAHRSALLWVERFAVPATARDQVQFLLWIAARINDVIPLVWARFDAVDDAVKSRAMTEDGVPPFILAGNPFADRFTRYGEEAALAWAVAQSTWSRRELAGMLIEVALEHDPDEAPTAVVAERLLRRALAFEGSSDATGYLTIVLIRQARLAEAIELAAASPRRDVRLLVVGEAAEHAASELAETLPLLDATTLRATAPEEVADLIGTVARYAPAHLDAVLAAIPASVALIPHLYNTSFAVERPEALRILRRVLDMPAPPSTAVEARTAFVMAWNNACIHAHALDDYKLAVELADGGQPYAEENPYIFHSAACAYAAVGEIDRAIAQVKLAIDHEYEHSERMETDSDLAPLHGDPRFTQLFVEWRTRRADLN